jgi:hypothetical protein
MNPRSSTRPSRPQTNGPANLLGSSTSGWYAAWKARKAADVTAPPSEPEPTPEEDAPDALARWLAGDTTK